MSLASSWQDAHPVHIVFGRGRLQELGAIARGRTLLVTSAGATRRGITGRVSGILGPDRTVVFDRVEANPKLDAVEEALRTLRRERIDAIVAIGGGSSLDLAKVLSVGLADPGMSLRAALEGSQRIDEIVPLSLIAIPTTAGTGSEVTPFATLWDEESGRKLSLASPALYPSTAILDPELTLSLPWEITLSTGLDAYSQCFESIWNHNATPISIAFAERGLATIPDALRGLKRDLTLLPARMRMLEASLLSGLAISRTRTALAHSMSYPITAHFGLPHGLACGFSVPAVLAFNLDSDDGRLGELAFRSGFGDPHAFVESIVELYRELDVAGAVRRHVPEYGALYELVPEMLTPGRADNNLRAPSLEGVREILSTTEAWLFAE